MTNQPPPEEIGQEMQRKAAAKSVAEANVYSLNNAYLTPQEKLEVEMWFQFPGDMMQWAFVITAIYSVYSPLSWVKIIIVTLLVNVIIGIWNWYFYKKNLINKLYLTVLHSWILYLVGFSAAVFLFFKGAIVLAIISAIAPFGLFAAVEPSMFIYSILATRYHMHPKFAFFKKEYNHIFPFEQDL